MTKQLFFKTEEEQIDFGKKVGTCCTGREIFLLYGDLGSGKTTFTRGVATALGIKESEVRSPTFTYMNLYPGQTEIYHYDLYRIYSAEDLESLGFFEYLPKGISLIEWPEKAEEIYPENAIRFYFEYHPDGRSITWSNTDTHPELNQLLEDMYVQSGN